MVLTRVSQSGARAPVRVTHVEEKKYRETANTFDVSSLDSARVFRPFRARVARSSAVGDAVERA